MEVKFVINYKAVIFNPSGNKASKFQLSSSFDQGRRVDKNSM